MMEMPRSEVLQLAPATKVVTREKLGAFLELSKPRILFLVLVATASGFYLAIPGSSEWGLWFQLVHALIGTSLVVAGSNALNQLHEAKFDALMIRTAARPVPSGRLSESEALWFGWITAILGILYVSLFTNLWAGALAAASFINYVFIYTPSKRLTTFCVFVGAVSGALPPVIGWAAAVNSLSVDALILFGIIFFWQLPHFASIAWLYRDDYASAGYPMIPVVDPDGIRLDMHMITHTVALLGVSVLPTIRGTAGPVYAVAAIVLGLGFLCLGAVFIRRKTTRLAKCHILASIIYLPLLFAAMMLDKVGGP